MQPDSEPRTILSSLLPLAITIVMLTFSFAPFNQSSLAWFALSPWLVFLAESRSKKSAFFWSWGAGTLFFSANMWWMVRISVPGMIALMIYCGLYWGLFGLVVRGAGLMQRRGCGVFAIAAVWTAFEWIRGNLMTGLPWLYLGHSQSPCLSMCQIADFGGAYAVSFWVAAVGALMAMAWLSANQLRPLLPAAVGVLATVLGVYAYGMFRLNQTNSTRYPGPIVAVVQPNEPQTNSGAKGASDQERIDFHVSQTLTALQQQQGRIDLAAWSETILPPINDDFLAIVDRSPATDFDNHAPRYVRDMVAKLASATHLWIISGAQYAQYVLRDGMWNSTNSRNSAALFRPDGTIDPARYDKIHLVPFGEFIPLKSSFPWIYDLFVKLGPKYYEDYELHPGHDMTIFRIGNGESTWRFATPICFEDIDSRLCAAMCRPEIEGQKRVDFFVNLTNDGWFIANENTEHLQASIFRAIENRVPIARSVNTGVSGFIDSVGQLSHLLRPRTEDHSVSRLMLDRRITFYSQFGDLFAGACMVATAVIVAVGCFCGKKNLEQAT